MTLFEDIKTGLLQAIAYEKGELNCRSVHRQFNKDTQEAYNETLYMQDQPDETKGCENLDNLWEDLGI